MTVWEQPEAIWQWESSGRAASSTLAMLEQLETLWHCENSLKHYDSVRTAWCTATVGNKLKALWQCDNSNLLCAWKTDVRPHAKNVPVAFTNSQQEHNTTYLPHLNLSSLSLAKLTFPESIKKTSGVKGWLPDDTRRNRNAMLIC